MQQIIEKPILFRREMVRAIQDETKTQTRRILKVQPASVSYWRYGEPSDRFQGVPTMRGADGRGWAMCGPFRCPYIPDGLCASLGGALVNSNREDTTDRRARLWVKETFYYDISPYAYGGSLRVKPNDFEPDSLYYRAEGECCTQIPECQCGSNGRTKWRSSMFMPRWASRITLEIESVRVERLQDISEADAEAEGIDFMRHIPDADETLTARQLYQILWESINGEGSWKTNPWVWAIKFKRV